MRSLPRPPHLSTARLLSLLAFLALYSCTDVVTKPNADISEIDGQPLNANRMVHFRDAGQGCLFTVDDSAGGMHALGLTRKALPFELPAISFDEKKGRRTGRPVRIKVALTDEKTLEVGCWIPSNMSGADLAAVIVGSRANGAWYSVYDAVLQRPVTPKAAFEKPLSREAQQFRHEWLDPSRKAMELGTAPVGASRAILGTWCNFTVVTVENRGKQRPTTSISVQTTCVCEESEIREVTGPNYYIYRVLHCYTEGTFYFEFDFGEDPEDTGNWEYGPELSIYTEGPPPQAYHIGVFYPYPTDGFYVGETHNFQVTEVSHPNRLTWEYKGVPVSHCAGSTSCLLTTTEGDGELTAILSPPGLNPLTAGANIIMYPCQQLPLNWNKCHRRLTSSDSARLHNALKATARNPSLTGAAAAVCDSLLTAANSFFSSANALSKIRIGVKTADSVSHMAQTLFGVMHIDSVYFYTAPEKILAMTVMHEYAHEHYPNHEASYPFSQSPWKYLNQGRTSASVTDYSDVFPAGTAEFPAGGEPCIAR